MKLTKEELIEKYSSKFKDQDEKIAFLEDISDSIEVKDEGESEEIKNRDAEIERLKVDNELLKQKYIDRFLGEVDEKTEEIDKEVDEPEEKEVIDIKEI